MIEPKRGRKIATFAALMNAAKSRKAVTGASIWFSQQRPYQPAAWVANMSAYCVHAMLVRGLYIYKGKATK